MRVVCQYMVNHDSLFLWDTNLNQKNYSETLSKDCHSMHLVGQTNNTLALGGGVEEPIADLLVSINQVNRKTPSCFNAVGGQTNTSLEFEIPLTFNAHPVYLEFNGRKCDFDAFAGLVSKDEVLSFYQKAWQAFRDESSEVFGSFCTESSRKRFNERLSEMKPDVRTAYINNTLAEGRRVFFVLDANPIYIVFYRARTKTGYQPVRYDYVIRLPGNQGLQLTHIYMEDSLDFLLRDSGLFLKSFLSKIMDDNAQKKGQK